MKKVVIKLDNGQLISFSNCTLSQFQKSLEENQQGQFLVTDGGMINLDHVLVIVEDDDDDDDSKTE